MHPDAKPRTPRPLVLMWGSIHLNHQLLRFGPVRYYTFGPNLALRTGMAQEPLLPN